jgi:hypothetical protein
MIMVLTLPLRFNFFGINGDADMSHMFPQQGPS